MGLILTYGLFYGSYGYLLIKIRKGLLQIHSEKTRNSAKTRYRNVRRILPTNALFLTVFFPVSFPIFDQTSKLWRNMYMYTCMASMVLLNSTCNPVFYVWRFSEPRYHMKRLLCFGNKDMVDMVEPIDQSIIDSLLRHTSSLPV